MYFFLAQMVFKVQKKGELHLDLRKIQVKHTFLAYKPQIFFLGVELALDEATLALNWVELALNEFELALNRG